MKDISILKENLVFHGTAETITGPLRGGGYDNILWTAEDSTIAQNYISSSGITVGFAKPWYVNDECGIRPEGVAYEISEQLGYQADIEMDDYNRLKSWGWLNNKVPTIQVILDFIEKELGYESDDNGIYQLKASLEDKKFTYLPANYKQPGVLYIGEGKRELNIYDYTTGRESDINNPDYHRLELFKKIESEGYDAIKIHDYAQSKNLGNVSHVSLGLFPRGIEKLKFDSIPAKNWDWKECNDIFRLKDTPEFLGWATEKGYL